ncbi:DUF4239 domain-containing protein (plasmid) [Deinococcus metallilatus]|uniref:DUF4239 domain-containing protein n=1 Tax=Deinococcus metallilatus TaxID=1211322 RepID=A0AAJ5FAB5_9DEIO|nr:DUF4239 domain-containing protein [Deinococcus metallilatus]MBB5295642.1 hypothetical protein [Deinococcus metallilatus]QBY06897.1 DUF4239 domain-containing protein [Deinococcus metallilatus]TLK32287.1 DUF4239 domain-containing protein [Deinococcus metallilatus]GMA14171.1 hypothetical protein GCM10025871_05020 [Deinococcus metallilatus]
MVWLGEGLFVALAVALALGGMLLVRRSVQLSVLEEHREVAGFIYAIIGVVYAVLLAFVVALLWQEQQEARVRVEQEANAIASLYRGAQAFPPAFQTELKGELRAYTEAVLRVEWPEMSVGQTSLETWGRYNRLWQTYLGFRPRNAYESFWYTQALTNLYTLGDARRLRLLSGRIHLPGLMWGVLWGGGVITIAFAYFFGVRNVRSQALMVAALSATIALILFLAMALDRSFTGAIQVGPEAFEQVLFILNNSASSTPP